VSRKGSGFEAVLTVWRLIGRSHLRRSLKCWNEGLVESGVAVNGDGVNEHQIAQIGGILRAQTNSGEVDCILLLV